jgi:hypothetical protein
LKFFTTFLIVLCCFSVTDLDYALSQEGDWEVENMEETLPVIPTPGPTPSEGNASKARSASDDEADFAELVKKQGGEYVGGKSPSAHWLRKNLGIRKIKGTGGSDDDVPFCMYTYGFRDPDVCFNPKTHEEIYRRGMDKSVLDEIKRNYRAQGLMQK